MPDIVIVGAGGFGKELKNLIDQLNKESVVEKKYNLIGFYDDNKKLPKTINNLPLLGNITDLKSVNKKLYIALGIGNPKIKEKILQQLTNQNFLFPSIVHPSVLIGDDVNIGRGSIICANTVLTSNIDIGEFVTINLNCTIGHDTYIDDYSSLMPAVNVSGNVNIANSVYLGTGSTIINQLSIGSNTTIGAGAVVTKAIPSNCTAVGIPATPIKTY